MKLVILFLAMLIANPALAVTCLNDYDNSCVQEPGHSTAGDCKTLGYSTTIEENCEHTIVCPFNSSYKRCVKLKEPTCEEKGYKSYTSGINDLWCDSYSYCREGMKTLRRCESTKNCDGLGFTSTTSNIPGCAETAECTDTNGKHYRCKEFEKQVTDCEALGFTTSNKKGWCKNIKTCPTTTQSDHEDWTLCATGIPICSIGDVYYSDDSCASLKDHKALYANDKSKTPIGVVFYTEDSGKKGKIMALQQSASLIWGYFISWRALESSGMRAVKLTTDMYLNKHDTSSAYFQGKSNTKSLHSTVVYSLGDNTYTMRCSKRIADVVKDNVFQAYFYGTYSELCNCCSLSSKPTTYRSGNTCDQATYEALCEPRDDSSIKTYCDRGDIYCHSALADAAVAYNPGGVHQGDWYIPAMGEVMDMVGWEFDQIEGIDGQPITKGKIPDDKNPTRNIVNETIKALGGTQFSSTVTSSALLITDGGWAPYSRTTNQNLYGDSLMVYKTFAVEYSSALGFRPDDTSRAYSARFIMDY